VLNLFSKIMIYRTIFFGVLLSLSISSIAQLSNEQIIASIPDKAATEDQLIYLVTIPEWDKHYSYAEPKIDIQKREMSDNHHHQFMPLGLQGGSLEPKQLAQFDTYNLRFNTTSYTTTSTLSQKLLPMKKISTIQLRKTENIQLKQKYGHSEKMSHMVKIGLFL